MRIHSALVTTFLMLASASHGALAQTATSPDTPPASSAAAGGTTHRLRDRFAAANTTHDGRLTQAQAGSAGLRMVAKNFEAIDTDHKGYVTIDQVRDYSRARRAARQAGNLAQ